MISRYKALWGTYSFMALLASSSCPTAVRATKCFLQDKWFTLQINWVGGEKLIQKETVLIGCNFNLFFI
jgi:hypothetical protein